MQKPAVHAVSRVPSERQIRDTVRHTAIRANGGSLGQFVGPLLPEQARTMLSFGTPELAEPTLLTKSAIRPGAIIKK